MHLFGIRQNSLPIKINRQVSHPTLIDVYRGSMALRMRFRESDHCIQIRKFVKYPQLQNIFACHAGIQRVERIFSTKRLYLSERDIGLLSVQL